MMVYVDHIALSSHPLVGRSLGWLCLLAIVSSISVNNKLATVFFPHSDFKSLRRMPRSRRWVLFSAEGRGFAFPLVLELRHFFYPRDEASFVSENVHLTKT